MDIDTRIRRNENYAEELWAYLMSSDNQLDDSRALTESQILELLREELQP